MACRPAMASSALRGLVADACAGPRDLAIQRAGEAGLTRKSQLGGMLRRMVSACCRDMSFGKRLRMRRHSAPPSRA